LQASVFQAIAFQAGAFQAGGSVGRSNKHVPEHIPERHIYVIGEPVLVEGCTEDDGSPKQLWITDQRWTNSPGSEFWQYLFVTKDNEEYEVPFANPEFEGYIPSEFIEPDNTRPWGRSKQVRSQTVLKGNQSFLANLHVQLDDSLDATIVTYPTRFNDGDRVEFLQDPSRPDQISLGTITSVAQEPAKWHYCVQRDDGLMMDGSIPEDHIRFPANGQDTISE
jgi:hypothetical protein